MCKSSTSPTSYSPAYCRYYFIPSSQQPRILECNLLRQSKSGYHYLKLLLTCGEGSERQFPEGLEETVLGSVFTVKEAIIKQNEPLNIFLKLNYK